MLDLNACIHSGNAFRNAHTHCMTKKLACETQKRAAFAQKCYLEAKEKTQEEKEGQNYKYFTHTHTHTEWLCHM